jgi:hypothetical protein
MLVGALSTKIEISEDTRAGLNRYASAMKQRLGRRVTFDEAIKELLEEVYRKPSESLTAERPRGWRRGKQSR